MSKQCLDCQKEIGPQALRCASCNYKWMSENKINPGNYKDGSYLKEFHCVDCGKILVKHGAKRCKDCYNIVLAKRLKENPTQKGRIASEETRKLQSLARVGKPSPRLGIVLTYEERLNLSVAHGGDGIHISTYLPNRGYISGFNKISHRIIERDKTCQYPDCSCEKDLTTHHINYNKSNNDDKNLIVLCRSHNSKVNKNKEYWQKYFSNKMT